MKLTELLTSFFIKKAANDFNGAKSCDTRYLYGRFAGIIGIVANLFLVIIKIAAGVLSGSISIIADGINNLSDAGSSIITLVGFKFSSAPPDKKHPFGHGRIEYIASFGIGILIIVAAVELGKSSLIKIINPTKTSYSILTFIILLISILVKLWLTFFNKNLGDKINSKALLATSVDSRNDVILTAIILISAGINHLFNINIDGFVGLAAAIFVLWSGIIIIKETINLLIGIAPSSELVKRIRDTALSYAGILGVHDIMVHSYGPTSLFISLHAEVSSNSDIIDSHDIVDEVEQLMEEQFNATVCIHMDPVEVDDPRTRKLKGILENVIQNVDENLSFHDFRVVYGENRTNLVFDLEIPHNYGEHNAIRREIQRDLWEIDKSIFIVATFENPMTEG